MPSVGVLIVLAILGAVLCAKVRAAAGAAVFTLVAVALFVSTPAGAGLPDAVATLLDTVNDSTSPALVDGPGAGR
jgi:hypothetical protein